jgi:hypothetical protein
VFVSSYLNSALNYTYVNKMQALLSVVSSLLDIVLCSVVVQMVHDNR